MNLVQPYGGGNHRRIAWRKAWAVDVEGLTATHLPTGFAMAFEPVTDGGYTARLGCALPPFGPDGRDAVAQMFGLRELMMDAWDIFHTVARK
jgi:hypothetical protein